MTRHLHRESGFTLVELAIVLVIVGFLLGGMLVSLSTQNDLRAASEEQKQTAEVIEALLGFAASRAGKPYLPCPDIDNDGVEDRDSNDKCKADEGNLPWADLGVGRTDAWNNHLRYRVVAAFASKTGFTLTTAGTLKVCRTQACAAADTLATGLPLVIVSHGKNGRGAVNDSGITNPLPGTGDDEYENFGSANSVYVAHPPTDDRSSVGEFDDVVAWISPNILFNRMIAAGRLP